MHTVHKKGGEGAATRLLLRSWPQDPQPINSLQARKKMLGEQGFPRLNRIQANLLQVAKACPHSHGFADGGSAGFKFVGQHSPGAVIQEHVLDHFATAEEWRHLL